MTIESLTPFVIARHEAIYKDGFTQIATLHYVALAMTNEKTTVISRKEARLTWQSVE